MEPKQGGIFVVQQIEERGETERGESGEGEMGKKWGKRGKRKGKKRGEESGGEGEQREREREERPLKEGTQRDESTFSLSLATTSERREYKPSVLC